MNLADIISLAKQGYTPKDIRDLIELATDNEPDAVEEKPDTSAPIEDKTEDTATEPAAEPASKSEPAQQPINNDTLLKEVESLKEQLKKAQENNINRNADDQKESNEDIMNNAFRNILS